MIEIVRKFTDDLLKLKLAGKTYTIVLESETLKVKGGILPTDLSEKIGAPIQFVQLYYWVM